MIEDEIELSLSLDDRYGRMKLILADNTVEIALLNLIRENAFDDWHAGGQTVQHQDRISLFYSFPKKVQYALKEDKISGPQSELINILHSYRNVAYHLAFNTVVNNSSNHWANDYDQSYPEAMDSIRYTLGELYVVIALETLRDVQSNIRMKNKYVQFIEENSSLKSELGTKFGENLTFRLERIKDCLAFSAAHSPSFNESQLSLDELQPIIDHLIANYGKQVVEKSSYLNDCTKEYFLKLYENNVDALDPREIEDDMKFATAEKIDKWENQLSDFNETMKPHVALKKWHIINKRLIVLEEIADYYVWIAC